jgi:hypothetical protein
LPKPLFPESGDRGFVAVTEEKDSGNWQQAGSPRCWLVVFLDLCVALDP